MADHTFCRDLAIERGEPLAGTGKVSTRVILVAWPRAKWRVPRFESVGMPAVLTQAIRAAMDAGIHVALVDRVGESARIAHLQADGIAADFADHHALAEAITRFINGVSLAGNSDTRPVILCCTDSRRDACCARFGFDTFKALKAHVDPAQFNLLQCTHLGGCRFAASIVVLPNRQRYGRLKPDQVPEFLKALFRNEIYLLSSRGNANLDEPAQVAELRLLHWGAERGHKQSVKLDTRTVIDEDHIVFSGSSGNQSVTLTVSAQSVITETACKDIGIRPPSARKRWVPGDVNAG